MALKQTMYPGQVNSRETITTSALNATDTSLTVLDAGLLPDAPNLLVLGAGSTAETVLMTAKNGNVLTLQRGFQGVPKTWALGTVIARNYTEYDYAAMLENITDVEGRLVATDAKVVDNTSAIGQLQSERLTQNLEVYISPSGSDTTGDGTQLNPYKTIQKGVDSIPFNSNKKVAFLKVAGGTYTEDVLINTMFSGAMVIDLLGNVIINGSIQIYTIPYIAIQNNTLTFNSTGKNALYVNNNCFLNIATPVTINGCTNGIFADNAARIKTNLTTTIVTINNATGIAIFVRNSASVTLQGNVGGTGNTKGFAAEGATIFINTENISSTTKITKTLGGQIWTGAGVNLT